MKISLIALMLAVAVQITLAVPRGKDVAGTTSAISEEVAVTQNPKRFKLAQFAYENLRKTVWPDELYPKMTKYMNELKEWADNDEALKKSTKYGQIHEGIENCVNLLKELTTDPSNCDKQLALRVNHDRLKTLFKSHENEKMQYAWIAKYAGFTLEMRDVMRKAYEKFYAMLAAEVDSFTGNLDELEKYQETDIVEWNEKFSKELDFIRKQILVIEFMGLFGDERSILEAKCKIQYSNGL